MRLEPRRAVVRDPEGDSRQNENQTMFRKGFRREAAIVLWRSNVHCVPLASGVVAMHVHKRLPWLRVGDYRIVY